jgi:valyl-tRNA synthetase
MTGQSLPKGYEPAEVDKRWADYWVKNETFSPDPDDPGEPYSIVIPPPNVTGALHMGHALNLTLQDILCRRHRQKGRKVLWIPGTDHAGIATQNVVERALKKEGLSRYDLGREKFIERVWEWKEEYGGRILNQIKKLGASVDWTRERFTMGGALPEAVRKVFVRLYNEGLVYKGDYIINWCTRCHTALADDEVEHASHTDKLYHIRYPLAKGDGYVVVATVRPETMLGDTAVAVHPEDERYAHLAGQYVVLPIAGRKLPIIGDSYVDREFGTGCLKITPAHDMNDYEIGRKHNLEAPQVIDADGRMCDPAPERFVGMSIDECRAIIVKELEQQGLIDKIEDYEHNVGECYRCKTVIEPHISTQWFVKTRPLADKARAAVPGATSILPDNWVKVYYDWLDNIRDWCVSRQIWWGHRIPAWTCQECGELIVAEQDPTSCPKCGATSLVQEEDVLDTWFSSALWPFSTLGWPEQTKDLKTFYPTTVLVTAFDILFFWVARMMMMGIHFMGEVPFKDVYIHALVRDEHGKKMSKSTGNVIDPLDMAAKYGADSLRFTLAAFAAMGRDIKLSEARIEGYRHFANKIWNAARFSLINLPEQPDPALLDKAESLADNWILHRLEMVKDSVDQTLERYAFNEAAQTLYQFIWRELCDWYLEMAKPVLYGEDEDAKAVTRAVLYTALQETLTLLHPFMPFLTQEIYTHLPGCEGKDLALERDPERRPRCRDEAAASRMDLFQGLVSAVRNIRTELGVEPAKKLSMLVRTPEEQDAAFILENAERIRFLARVDRLEAGPDIKGPKASGAAVVLGNEVFVPLEGAVDIAAELARLDKEMAKLDKELGGVRNKLSKKGFVEKAPAEVVQKERDRETDLVEKQEKLSLLRKRLESLAG